MDYKEKYEKALETARKLNADNLLSDEATEEIFPELALSEDEKMIIGLQGFLSAYGSDYFGTDGWQKVDDWLEKQKEQKPAENGGKELLYVSNKSYNIGYRDGKREAEQKTAKRSEEDADMLNCCISSIEEAKENRYAYKETDGDTSYDREISWLKSLRPSWKPSEEQMYSLGSVVNGAGEATEGSIAYHLKDLYERLKKL